MDTYNSEDVLLDIVHFGVGLFFFFLFQYTFIIQVGPVSDSDVTMAQTFNAIVYVIT